jgi:ligand-binding sensor domain-containing protein/DNA-binding CsgD family transcriptional regulator
MMRLNIVYVLLLMLWMQPRAGCGVVFAASGEAQIGTPGVRNYPRDVHGAGTQTWDVETGPDGWIYAANNDGLLVFNGQSWSLHPQPRRTVMRSLVLDSNGTVYVGGQGELGFFRADASGHLQYHSLLQQLPKRLRELEDVWNLQLLGEHLYWRSSGRLYRMRVDGRDSAAVHPSPDAIQFLACLDRQLLVHVAGQGLMRLDATNPMGNSFERLDGVDVLVDALPTALVNDGQGGLIISTLKQGLHRLNASGQLQPFAPQWTDWFAKNRIYTATLLRDGRLALGTTTAGVVLMDRQGDLRAVYDRVASLQNNNVLALAEDAQGNLWLGLDNGIDMVAVGSALSRILPDAPLEGSGYAMAQFKGRYYFGTNNGLYVMDPKAPWSEQRFRFIAGSRGQVWSLGVFRDQLLVGHHEGAFRLVDDRLEPIAGFEGCWRFLELPPEAWTASGLVPDGSAKAPIVLAGAYDGLHSFRWSMGRWLYEGKLEGFEESARLMAVDPQGWLWIAHPYKGLWRARWDGQALRDVRRLGAENGLPSIDGVKVFQVAGDAVFTLPGEGAWRYQASADTFVRHERIAHLIGADKDIRAILPGEGEDLWCATHEAMFRLSITDKGLEKTVEAERLPALSETLLPGFEYLYDPQGPVVFLASERGFVQYSERAGQDLPRAQLHLLRVEAGKRLDSVVFAGYGERDSAAVQALPTYMRSIRFRYAATEYEASDRVRYAWRLEGYDAKWSEWTAETSKDFTNLKPGRYRFEVVAKDAQARVLPMVQYAFEVAKPWHATSLAYVVYLLVITSLLTLLVLAPQRRFAREKVRLQSEKEQTLREQEAKHQQTVESRERALATLRNEKLKVEIDHQNRQLAMSTMHLVQKNAIITRIKEEMAKVEKDVEHPQVRKTVRSVLQLLDSDHRLDEDWEQFSIHFDKVHTDFLGRLRQHYPQLTPKDQRLCAFLRLNLSSKEIAPLLNISIRGVEISRYRLRKKLGLETEVNLVDFLMGI